MRNQNTGSKNQARKPNQNPERHTQRVNNPPAGTDRKRPPASEAYLPRTKITLTKEEVLSDFRIGTLSRAASLVGRKEVLTGKAKFGIFGDGKEVPQLAMARAFRNGDFRSGYYRDQTFMLATGMTTLEAFFAQLYADTDPRHEPASSGRMMNAHFATPLVNDDGSFINQLQSKNSSADISPTAGQMSRALGLAYASKLYRQIPALKALSKGFSSGGSEICFATIGDASTSEGIFFEALNAAGVLQVPLMMSVWDDGYGISVPREFQTTRGSISTALSGFASDREGEGFIIETVKGWDYLALVDCYLSATIQVRRTHKPALIHVTEVTQPQGHSTSGSHERYKSESRLQWEKDFCCMARMRTWIVGAGIATSEELDTIESSARTEVERARNAAWQRFQQPIIDECERAIQAIRSIGAIQDARATGTQLPSFAAGAQDSSNAIATELNSLAEYLEKAKRGTLYRRQVQATLHRVQSILARIDSSSRRVVDDLLRDLRIQNHSRFNSHLLSESKDSPLLKTSVAPTFSSTVSGASAVSVALERSDDSDTVDGRVVLQKCFEHHLETNPRFFALGEDVGKLGDVNLVFEGLNAKFGDLRVSDTGIREATILGQGIGCALRGLRPLVDIQYLDYLIYALQVMSDDLATAHYRSAGIQKCPVIVRTKGHRLEGIWHTGSPLGMILSACRGMHVCVPRNMTQAAGMYNVLLNSDDPALVIEVLNGYRLKERVPTNVGSFRVALGEPEILREGRNITLVTYGACCRIALDAAAFLSQWHSIDVEVIDVQTLLPFDRPQTILQSLKKTSKLLIVDEDVPGGASAYLYREILETQQGFHWLEALPRTLTAQPNRAAYASDGDYFCKPSAENIVDSALSIMHEIRPQQYPIPDPLTADLWQRSSNNLSQN
jgi:pyruvate/2-oxoglutarate/acetoin dehydrogenase E1 component/TPP-dependent pyruvate/acetoin dehydrogenase alpha subunit